MTIAIILFIIVALGGIGSYLVRVGKKIAKADQADDIYEDISKINKMEREEVRKANELIAKGEDADGDNPINATFPRVRSPFIRRK